jgi:hypothetical protein
MLVGFMAVTFFRIHLSRTNERSANGKLSWLFFRDLAKKRKGSREVCSRVHSDDRVERPGALFDRREPSENRSSNQAVARDDRTKAIHHGVIPSNPGLNLLGRREECDDSNTRIWVDKTNWRLQNSLWPMFSPHQINRR